MVIDKKRKWRRKNGLSWPLDPLQLLAWFFTFLFALIYFKVMVPSLPDGTCQTALIYIMAIILSIHCILHITCNVIDPCDVEVRTKRQDQPLPEFDREKHSRVIENQYCHICEVKVGPNSKHCSSCNKCVAGFDHHCKWLNNCVGTRNYRLFLGCISTALVSSLLLFVMSVLCAVHAINKVAYRCSCFQESIPINNFNSTTFSSNASSSSNGTKQTFVVFVPVTKQLWLAIIFVTLVLTVIAFSLLAHLLGFHFFLISKGFSTYGYILRQREIENREVETCKNKRPRSQCSLPQSNKKVAPHVPDAIESNNSSHNQRTHNTYKLKGVAAQMKKDSFSISKEGLCSSGNVYIGSPTKSTNSPNDSNYTLKMQQIYRNEGFVAQDNQPKSETKEEDKKCQSSAQLKHLCIDAEDPVAKEELDVKPSLKSRSPSLNNLMVDEEEEERCKHFDNLDDCMESEDHLIITADPDFVETNKGYVHNMALESDTSDYPRNNNNEDDDIGQLPKVCYRNIKNSRSLSLDNYDCSKMAGDGVSRRSCSVEIHYLAENHSPSLTPVDSEIFSGKKYEKPSQNVLQSITSINSEIV